MKHLQPSLPDNIPTIPPDKDALEPANKHIKKAMTIIPKNKYFSFLEISGQNALCKQNKEVKAAIGLKSIDWLVHPLKPEKSAVE